MELVDRKCIEVFGDMAMYVDEYTDGSIEFQYIKLNSLDSSHFEIDRRYKYWSEQRKQKWLHQTEWLLNKDELSEEGKEYIRMRINNLNFKEI